MWIRSGSVTLAMLLSGCATVGPNYLAPTTLMPPSYSQASPANSAPVTPETQWWSRFSDKTLNTLITRGLSENLTLAQARERIVAARETAITEGVSGLPTFNGTASSTWTASNQANAQTSSFVFDASWEIDLFGGLSRQREAAVATIEATAEEANDAAVTLTGDIAEAYVEARGYQARLALAQTTLKSQRETEELTKQQVTAGTATSLDLAQASASASATAADIPTLEISLQTSVHRLGVLLGLEPAALEKTFRSSGSVPRAKVSINAGIPADLVRNRPDIRQAERNLAAATAKIGVATADLYPSLSLSGSLTIGSTGAISQNFGPILSLPIFNAGARKAAVNLAESNARQDYLAYRETVLEALEEVENALVAYRKQIERRDELQRTVTNYEKVAELAADRHEVGEVSLFDVLTAQRSLYSARSSLAEANVAVATQYIALCKALGGGWNSSGVTANPKA